VDPEEAEDAILDPHAVSMPAYNVGREGRYALVGRVDDSGRYLFVVYTHRRTKIRVITARDATDREKRRYGTRGK
jgi:uncharacterized DUF497 family protein